MTSVNSLGVDVRLLVQQGVAEKGGFDYNAVLKRIGADKKVTAGELKAVAKALDAEVAAGHIDAARAKQIMGGIEGRAVNDKLIDKDTIVKTDLGDLSFDKAKVEAFAAADQRRDDRALLSKDVRELSKDGALSKDDMDKLWKDAKGSDATVGIGDVKQLYAPLDGLLKNGKITQKQHDAMVASADNAFAKNKGDLTDATKSYLEGSATAAALPTGPSGSAATWSNAIDMMVYALPAAKDGKRLDVGTSEAFITSVLKTERPLTDSTANAVASALGSAVDKGLITEKDAKRIANRLDERISFQRFGIGAKKDFVLVGAQFAAKDATKDPTTTAPGTTAPAPTGTDTGATRSYSFLQYAQLGATDGSTN